MKSQFQLLMAPRLIIQLIISFVVFGFGAFLFFVSFSIQEDFSQTSWRQFSIFIVFISMLYFCGLSLEVKNFLKSKKTPYLVDRKVLQDENFSDFIKNGRVGVVVDEYIFEFIRLKTFPYTTKQMQIMWLLLIAYLIFSVLFSW